ncbi:MAG TPA: hypothetical protein VEJ19_00990 [Nitrososphaerales archaeon]|nr:hypothetical protein [Nitrososphaerales archaeon]
MAFHRVTLTGLLIVAIIAFMTVAVVPPASSQTQYVQATPGFINLGMNTTITINAPVAGTYTVKVQEPSGAVTALNFTFSAAGQAVNATFGSSSAGFDTVVNQVGTYNVFLLNGNTAVATTSFYTTNKLIVTMDMVVAGTCTFVQGVTRGEQFIPRFYAHYASNDAPMTNNTKGASINFTTPSGQVENAPWDGYAHLFDNAVSPNWNYTYVGAWSPEVNASDGLGNTGTYKYTGSPFVITPAELSTSITLLNTSTGQGLASISNGEGVTIVADITYPANAEPTPGFAGPLTPTRGGSVTAQVGWGFYNMTSGTFGGTKSPGALIGTVLMTYSNKTWTGQFESNSLPTLPAGATFEVAVSSKDSASPVNAGFAIANLAPATATTSSTLTQTTTQSIVQTTTQSVVQTVQSIPTAVYAALVILLILGLLIGYIIRVPRNQ